MSQKKKKIALLFLMFNMFITMGGIGIIIPVLPSYLEIFGVGGQVLGFLTAIFALAQFLFSPISGDLSDRYGRKVFIVGGLIIYGIAQILFGLASEVWLLFLARFLSGFGAAFIMPPVMAYVADITTVEERGKGMGMIGAAISLGFMIGPGLGGFLATVNLHFPFYLAGIVALLAGILSFIVLPNIQPQTSGAQSQPRENLITQLVRSVKTPYFILLIVVFTFSFGIANFQATLSMFLTLKFDYTPTDIAIVVTLGGLSGVILQMFIVDKLFKKYGEMKVILVNLVVAAITMVLIIFVSGFFMILLVSTLFQIATVFIRPAVNTLISKFAGADQGFAAGMNNAYMSLGNMIGPALAGVLLEWKLSSPFILGTFILLGCYALAYGWTRKKAPALMHAEVK
ncbi:DHA1 family multidrug resistance protein-like MFS transporter [Ureibacillus xyleni]|uniref:DHA1 family multidrug resistance protein-like MFS transporter n=1 Tax=Ureibacillus xyleni TaxID=614648 RepID=A0A285RD08_9BACL|nr:MFS transporter [Ureibacillus xyleni]SOB91986.1 DHA1 family multidrug resistance protein-like MFS transporter [Ureibacillus xyleni]